MSTAPVESKEYEVAFLGGLMERMLLIRRFEEKAAHMYGLRKIGGFCHLYIGQEASGVGAAAAIDTATDYVYTAYRDHGLALACGMEPGPLMAELFGKEAGCSRGKGGSMHFFDVKRHFMGGNGIVGAHIPLAAGTALAIRNRHEKGVVLCFFGDGAIHQGSFHEALNMAAIWKLPVLYICENNQYGMGTDFRRVSAVSELFRMGASYGIPGKQVDGMDVLAVYEAVHEEVERIRGESKPGFIEIRTYRYKGHSMSDPAKYRTKEELDAYRQQDPILLLKAQMTGMGILADEQYREIDGRAKRLADDAVAFAEAASEPAVSALTEDVLCAPGGAGG
ncbi:MAG: pyruvate dehydrogenase (acetyl-transferring) E1 component subunit alpha [Chitinispirillaceae bacterium]|nr:pyruvate dehydrogenase (acetyl-transferring) E1 component subunit alpha [Chitinispirillaceae bacterium]